MLRQQSTNSRPELASLTLTCLAHAEQEEAVLAATLESLRQVRSALMKGDLAVLNEALGRQGHTARAAAELRTRRDKLRDELAKKLGQPPQSVTLQALAHALPGETGERLAGCRARLKQMADEAERLNRGNAALIRQSMDFLHRLFAGITGERDCSHRYGPAGERTESSCPSIIEGRG